MYQFVTKREMTDQCSRYYYDIELQNGLARLRGCFAEYAMSSAKRGKYGQR